MKKLNGAMLAGDAHAGGEGQASACSAPDRARPIAVHPPALAKLVKDETEKWAVPIKASGVVAD